MDVSWGQGSTVRPFHSHLRVNILACERQKQNRITRASAIYCAFTPNAKGRNDSIQSNDSICSATLLPGTGERVNVDFRWICSTPLLLELKYLNFAATFA